jgi:hypothetical protein
VLDIPQLGEVYTMISNLVHVFFQMFGVLLPHYIVRLAWLLASGATQKGRVYDAFRQHKCATHTTGLRLCERELSARQVRSAAAHASTTVITYGL